MHRRYVPFLTSLLEERDEFSWLLPPECDRFRHGLTGDSASPHLHRAGVVPNGYGDEMRLCRSTSWLVVATALLTSSAQAHEGGIHSRGTVKEITADRIVLAITDGKTVAIAMEPNTRVVRGGHAIRPSEVRLGERAVVHASTRDGKLEATEVMVAPASR